MSDFLQRLKREVLIDNGAVFTDLKAPGSDLIGSFQRYQRALASWPDREWCDPGDVIDGLTLAVRRASHRAPMIFGPQTTKANSV